jgi:arylsulfatase A-like enzyme
MVDATKIPAPVRNASRDQERAVHPFLDAWLATQADPAYFESQVDVQTLPEADLAEMRAVYYGLIAEVDAQLGRLFAALEKSGELDETLIIFTSDHGEMLGDHWCWGKAGWFEASNHIPLIIRDPRTAKRARGRRVDAFTESVDLVPTILDWLGRESIEEANGLSLMPFLKGETPAAWRDAVFWEYDFRTPHTQRAEQHFGLTSDQCTMNILRDAAYKYVHFTAQPPLLYDLARDPGELTNIAGDPAMAPVIARYAQKLLSHRMLHAERSLANAQLTSQGVVHYRGPRGPVSGTYGS